MKVTRFNHAAISAPGRVEELQRFYTEMMGIPQVPRVGVPDTFPGFWLQLGTAQVHVIGVPNQGGPRNPVGPHISFYVQDLAAALEELTQRGIEITKMGDGPRSVVWFSDPAGNTVEIQQDPQL